MPFRPKTNHPDRRSGTGVAVPAGGAMMPQRRLGDTPIPPRSGFSGGPSASADVQFSRTLGTPLDGCPDPYFEDCPDEEVEELDLEEILRE